MNFGSSPNFITLQINGKAILVQIDIRGMEGMVFSEFIDRIIAPAIAHALHKMDVSLRMDH